MHFRSTVHCCCHAKPLSGSSVMSGIGRLTETRRSPIGLLSPPKQT